MQKRTIKDYADEHKEKVINFWREVSDTPENEPIVKDFLADVDNILADTSTTRSQKHWQIHRLSSFARLQ